jgi:hypothetical protein
MFLKMFPFFNIGITLSFENLLNDLKVLQASLKNIQDPKHSPYCTMFAPCFLYTAKTQNFFGDDLAVPYTIDTVMDPCFYILVQHL